MAKSKGVILSITEVLLAYVISFAILIIFFYILTRDILTGLGIYIAFVSWWGWPVRHIELSISLQIISGILTPIALAIILRYIAIRRASLKGVVGLILSLSIYYIAGETYYMLFPDRRPDIELAIAFSIWIPLLAISSFIAYNLRKLCSSTGIEIS